MRLACCRESDGGRRTGYLEYADRLHLIRRTRRLKGDAKRYCDSAHAVRGRHLDVAEGSAVAERGRGSNVVVVVVVVVVVADVMRWAVVNGHCLDFDCAGDVVGDAAGCVVEVVVVVGLAAAAAPAPAAAAAAARDGIDAAGFGTPGQPRSSPSDCRISNHRNSKLEQQVSR